MGLSDRSLVLGALLAWGCAERSLEPMTWPELADARTAILHLSGPAGRRTEVLRVEAGALDRGRLQLEVDGPTVVELFLYARTAEELGLTSGEVARSPGSVSLVERDTSFRARWRLELDADEAPLAWRAGAGEALPDLGLPEASVGCIPFEVEVLEMGLPSDPLLIEVDPAGRYRVLFREGALRTYEGEHLSLVSYQLLAAARIGDRWWVMDGYANLHELDPDAPAPALRLLSYGDMSQGYAIAGHAEAGRTEIYLLAQSGALDLWDGSVRRTLHRFTPSEVDYNDRAAGLAWLGEDHVLAAWATSSDVTSVRAGRSAVEVTGSDAGLVSLRALPSGRVAAGNAVGGIFVRDPSGRWAGLSGAEIKLWPLSFGELGERLVYGAALGSFASHHPRAGFCAASQPYYGATFRVMTVAEDAVYLGGTARGNGVVLRLRPKT